MLSSVVVRHNRVTCMETKRIHSRREGAKQMSVLQDLIAKRSTLIDEVSTIEAKIMQIVKQKEEFDLDVYCDSYKGGN